MSDKISMSIKNLLDGEPAILCDTSFANDCNSVGDILTSYPSPLVDSVSFIPGKDIAEFFIPYPTPQLQASSICFRPANIHCISVSSDYPSTKVSNGDDSNYKNLLHQSSKNNVNSVKNGVAMINRQKRRCYDEIERYYKCKWENCDKAYGTLNHLNHHISLQGHGPRRKPQEFKELRQWLKYRQQIRRQEEERERIRRELLMEHLSKCSIKSTCKCEAKIPMSF